MANPINPAIDQFIFTMDTDKVFELMLNAYNGGEPWIVWGAEIVDDQKIWCLGRINKERVELLPSFLPLYNDDFMTGLRKLVANGVPVDPPLSDERLSFIGGLDELDLPDGL